MSFDAFDENCKKTHLLGIKSNICVIKGLRDMVSAEQVDGNKKKNGSTIVIPKKHTCETNIYVTVTVTVKLFNPPMINVPDAPRNIRDKKVMFCLAKHQQH